MRVLNDFSSALGTRPLLQLLWGSFRDPWLSQICHSMADNELRNYKREMFSEVTEICGNPLYFCSWLAAHLARWKQNAAHRACVEIEVRRGSKDGKTSRLSRSKTCCLGGNFCHKPWQGTPGSLVSFEDPFSLQWNSSIKIGPLSHFSVGSCACQSCQMSPKMIL